MAHDETRNGDFRCQTIAGFPSASRGSLRPRWPNVVHRQRPCRGSLWDANLWCLVLGQFQRYCVIWKKHAWNHWVRVLSRSTLYRNIYIYIVYIYICVTKALGCSPMMLLFSQAFMNAGTQVAPMNSSHVPPVAFKPPPFNVWNCHCFRGAVGHKPQFPSPSNETNPTQLIIIQFSPKRLKKNGNPTKVGINHCSISL
jgi:hypothetical protein